MIWSGVWKMIWRNSENLDWPIESSTEIANRIIYFHRIIYWKYVIEKNKLKFKFWHVKSYYIHSGDSQVKTDLKKSI